MNDSPNSRLIGIDYGRRRVGIALSDPLQIITVPHGTFPTGEVYHILDQLVREMEVEAIVVGYPYPQEDDADDVSSAILDFFKKTTQRYPHLTVELADETFTSLEARDVIRKSGTNLRKPKNKHAVDAVAAAIILQRYIDER